jgi:hypothetical protein
LFPRPPFCLFLWVFLSHALSPQIVDSAVWSDAHDMIAALSDQKLLVWYCPNVVYIDRDLLVRLARARVPSDRLLDDQMAACTYLLFLAGTPFRFSQYVLVVWNRLYITIAPSRSSFVFKSILSRIHFYSLCVPSLETFLFSITGAHACLAGRRGIRPIAATRLVRRFARVGATRGRRFDDRRRVAVRCAGSCGWAGWPGFQLAVQ